MGVEPLNEHQRVLHISTRLTAVDHNHHQTTSLREALLQERPPGIKTDVRPATKQGEVGVDGRKNAVPSLNQ